jgi:deoxyribonuclease (pyrimidine dimer)
MTRINTVPPSILSDAHLLIEIQEIPRIPVLALNRLKSRKSITSTGNYKLGSGHVIFFYDKIAFLKRRLDELCNEAHTRGFDDKTRIDDGRWAGCKSYIQCWNDWNPDTDAINENLTRLVQKIERSTVEPKYYREKIERTKFINEILNKS